MPKISVIIPVYNTEKFLSECLDSVLKQTLKDIEIICIDDGSTDNSMQVLRDYNQKYNNVLIFTQKNSGAGIARNLGIKKSKGEFIAFMDSDDIYPDNDILETLYKKAIENNVLICGGEMAEFENKQITQSFEGVYKEKYLFNTDKLIEFQNYQFDFGYTRFIYNRNFLLENNLFFPDYLRFQDPPFFVNALSLAKKFYAINKITYSYRMNHKELVWNEEKISNLIYGLLDVLIVSRQKKYHNLFNVINERFYCQYIIDIENNLSKKNIALFLKFMILSSKKLLVKYLLQKMFSVKNSIDKRHKVITLIGFKIKFKH